MFKIPVAVGIVNAAARLAGTHGDVTHQAAAADCSRQTVYDHAQKVQAAVEAEHSGGPTRAELIQENHHLRRENAQLWDWLAQTIEFPPSKQQEFTATATAMGLSLNQVLILLALLMSTQARPGRSTIQRWIKAAGLAAGRVLKHLDGRCTALVLIGCLDEIFFHRRPVLVGVEPSSMVWFLGQKATDRTGQTWSQALQPWTALQLVLADAGTGLQGGIAQVHQQRQGGQVPLENGLDVFHTTQEGKRALSRQWHQVETLWEEAEAATRRVEQARRRTGDTRGVATAAATAWTRAEAAFARYEATEAGWASARSALRVFRPDGRLNDRGWAQRQIASALPHLSGRLWSKVRGFLQAEPTLTFLDRLHRQLQETEPNAELREALVRLWWLRRQRPRGAPGAVITGAGHVAHLVQQVACQRLDAQWAESSYRRVSAVLRQAVRASSAVECMNSVLRMHQARHRTVTQGLLDLKRLYWNCRAFREGKRRGRCPYEHLGLKLPSYRFWDLLKMPVPELQLPVRLTKEALPGKARAAYN